MVQATAGYREHHELLRSGGWMRIANVDMRNNQSQCPPGELVYSVVERRRLCHKPSLAPGYSSTTFSTHGVRYMGEFAERTNTISHMDLAPLDLHLE